MPPEERDEETAASRRKRLMLERAVLELVRHGRSIHNLTVAEVVEAANVGITRQGFYGYYENLSSCFVDGLEAVLEARHARIAPPAAGEPLHDHITRVLTAQADLWLDEGRILLASQSLAADDPAHRAWVEAQLEPWWRGLAAAARAAAGRGEIALPIDVGLRCRLLVLGWYFGAALELGPLAAADAAEQRAAAEAMCAAQAGIALDALGAPRY